MIIKNKNTLKISIYLRFLPTVSEATSKSGFHRATRCVYVCIPFHPRYCKPGIKVDSNKRRFTIGHQYQKFWLLKVSTQDDTKRNPRWCLIPQLKTPEKARSPPCIAKRHIVCGTPGHLLVCPTYISSATLLKVESASYISQGRVVTDIAKGRVNTVDVMTPRYRQR